MNMRTSIRQVGTVTVVDMKGRIVLGEESASVRDLARDLLSNTDKVESVLQITKLYTVFEILDDEAVAVESFKTSRAAAV
jgi:anti-sigma B factor antagonist